MTNKSLIAGLASVAAMAAVLWSMPAAADTGLRVAHDKWPTRAETKSEAASAQADNQFKFITPAGSTIMSEPVNAFATFTTSADMIAVTLKNLEANPTGVAENLSDLSFTLGGGGSLSGASLGSSSGQTITVHDGGSFMLGSSVATGWGFTHTTNSVDLNVLGTSTGPAHTIIGPPGAGGVYSAAGGSIAGNMSHNPFLNQTATFTITGTGITAGTTITAATFSFNTQPGSAEKIVGEPAAVGVPEPGSFGLLVLGLAGVLIVARRRRRTDSAQA